MLVVAWGTRPWLMGSRVVLCGCVGFGCLPARVCVGGGMLSGSGAVRPGCGPARRAGPSFVWGVGLACVGGLVVICIVDASIFVLCVVIVVVFVWVVLCVCFFGRSVDALASGADEGRGGLR